MIRGDDDFTIDLSEWEFDWYRAHRQAYVASGDFVSCRRRR